MIVFDENFRTEGANYMLFELPEELHTEFKTTKELKIKSSSLAGDAVIVSKDSTYQLKRNEISNTLAIAESIRDDTTPLGSEHFSIKSMKQYKIVCEKIFPPKKDLITYLKKRTISIVTLLALPPSFTLQEILRDYPISDAEIYKVLSQLGCNFSPEFPEDPIYLYSQELKLQCYNDLVTLLKDPDCDINLNSFIMPEIGYVMRYPNELIKITLEEFLHRDSEDLESAKYGLDLKGAAKYTVLTLFSHMASYIYEEFLDVSAEFMSDFLPIELVDRYSEGERGMAIFREMAKVAIVVDNEDYSGGAGGYSKNLCVVKRFDV
jgi:hypothetical protein